jgi:hypothetical protein
LKTESQSPDSPDASRARERETLADRIGYLLAREWLRSQAKPDDPPPMATRDGGPAERGDVPEAESS